MNKNMRLILVITLITLVIMIILLLFLKLQNKNEEIDNYQAVSIKTNNEIEKEINKAVNDSIKEELSNLSEQKRIEYYATDFIKALEARNITKAYRVLNEDFKNNYFNNEDAFGKYIKKYFPKETSTEYKNMERLGDIYVLVVDIKDILSSDPNNFECYIVIRENDYNDYELSFSVDSAMKKYSEEN